MPKNRYEVEEMILTMADIVMEKRVLREEVKELREVRDEYYEYLSRRASESEEVTRKMIGVALKGALDNTKSNNDILLELVDCIHIEM